MACSNNLIVIFFYEIFFINHSDFQGVVTKFIFFTMRSYWNLLKSSIFPSIFAFLSYGFLFFQEKYYKSPQMRKWKNVNILVWFKDKIKKRTPPPPHTKLDIAIYWHDFFSTKKTSQMLICFSS